MLDLPRHTPTTNHCSLLCISSLIQDRPR